MGFFSELFSRRKRSQKMEGNEKRAEEGDVEEILKQRISQVWESGGKFEPDRIRKSIESVKNAADGLSKAVPEKDDVYIALAAMSKSSRDNICILTRNKIKTISLSSLKEFHASAKKALETIGDSVSRHGKRARILFQSKYLELLSSLKGLSEHYDSTAEAAKEMLKKEKKLSAWLAEAKEYKKCERQMQDSKKEAESLKAQIDEDESELTLLQGKLLNLEKSDEFLECKKAEESLAELGKKIRAIKGDFADMVSGTEKALVFYMHKLADSPSRKTIEKMLESRQDFILSENALKDSINVFSKLREGMKSGAISLGEKREKKIASLLETFGEKRIRNLFSNLKESQESYKKQREKAENSRVKEQTTLTKNKINAHSKRISLAKEELRRLNERIGEKQKELTEKQKRIIEIKKALEA